jgi:hypothetical protein
MEEFIMKIRTLYKIKDEKYYYYFDAEKLEWVSTVPYDLDALYRFKNEFSAVKDYFNNQVAFARYIIQGLDNAVKHIENFIRLLETKDIELFDPRILNDAKDITNTAVTLSARSVFIKNNRLYYKEPFNKYEEINFGRNLLQLKRDEMMHNINQLNTFEESLKKYLSLHPEDII